MTRTGAETVPMGPRPWQTRPYFARLTQALITALTAPMAQGRLYEVDMRLRPSGTQGPVATSWTSFPATSGRSLDLGTSGPDPRPCDQPGDRCGAGCRGPRASVLSADQDRAKVLREGRRDARAYRCRQEPGSRMPRPGAGRMQDVELIAQAGGAVVALCGAGCPAGGPAGGVTAAGWIATAPKCWRDCYQLLLVGAAAARLSLCQALDSADMGDGRAAFCAGPPAMTASIPWKTPLGQCYDRADRLVLQPWTRKTAP